MSGNDPGMRAFLTGLPASPGLAVGRICFWSDAEGIPRYAIAPEMIPVEMARLQEALTQSREQLVQMRERAKRELGESEAAIFSSHTLLLDDPGFYARVEKRLVKKNINLEAAVEEVIEDIARVFMKIPDSYLRERADDYRDIGRRVLENLLSRQRQCALEEGERIVLVARELMPSDTIHFKREEVAAFVTERGGVSSHAAILARSLRLPAVVGLSGALSKLRAGDRVVVDGTMGKVITEPSEEEIARAQRDRAASQEAFAQPRPAQPTLTQDQVPIRLLANLTREEEAEDAHRLGALGIGLLRTEFLFMDQGQFLSEAEQYRIYRHVVEIMAPQPVTIRTLDLGEDKQFGFTSPAEAPGYVLGWRSLRLSLAYQDIFLDQLRAILKAAAHGQVKILLPMVSGVEELRQVRSLVKQVAAELDRRQETYQADVPLGAMIETPAAAVVPEIILQEADFLSVGTNDLVQYTMVADRTSNLMQPYYRPTSPAVLALLKRLAQASAVAGKDISICGEIAGDPLYLPLLLGLGYRSLSVAPVLIPDLADAINKVSIPQAEALARQCLQLSTAEEIENLLHAHSPK